MLLGSPREQEILLRWAPTSPDVWRLGNAYGYKIERFTLLRDGEIPENVNPVLLNEEPFRPMDQQQWARYIDSDKYVAIAAECIFSSTFKGLDSQGNPHMVYKMYLEEQHRYSFALYSADQSMDAARLSGLFFADTSARQNEKYLYRVFIDAPDSFAVDTGFVFTGLSEYQPLPKAITPMARWGNKSVSLSWNIMYLNHIYNSYVLERSTDNGESFQRLGENAIVQLSDEGIIPHLMYRTDSLLDNQNVYHYRVRGVSAFGELGPPSEPVSGTGRLPLENPPTMVAKNVINNEVVELTWEYPDEMNPYIQGFRVYHSPGPNGRKEILYDGHEPARRTFVDTNPDITNYYLVSVYNEENESVSLNETYVARVDSFPPLAPQGLVGRIDSLGHVSITWHANKERDLDGYRVYVSNHPNHEFLLSTPALLKDTMFYGSINITTLSRSVYYRVTAVDVRQNQSSFSEILELKRPDQIPPVAPRLVSLTEDVNSLVVEWIPSFSSDVVKHYVSRKVDGEPTFELLAELEYNGEEMLSYIDRTVNKGVGYSYFVIAGDESELLSSPSNIRHIKISGGGKGMIQLKYIRRIDHVVLEWDKEADGIVRIVVYRSEGEEPIRIYGNSDESQFIDRALSPGKSYTYRISAIYADGTSSQLSNPVQVNF
ncbi:fibronectin type III domain-containing protein [Alkaliflexus imshenetskii]|uniref:hypothetical protein n=1 Tax=Alkaliflexus imshenetskii TaxID=286730 RepID=UPI00047908DC|nr:hypothetical protein [Alkaliflexus imshenetskii]